MLSLNVVITRCRSETTVCLPATRALDFAAKPLVQPRAELRPHPHVISRPAYWSTRRSDEIRHEKGGAKVEYWRETLKAKCRDRN